MLSDKSHAEASAMHLRRTRGVAEAGRRVGHGAQLLFRGRAQRAAFRGPVHHAAAPEAVAVAHAAQDNTNESLE